MSNIAIYDEAKISDLLRSGDFDLFAQADHRTELLQTMAARGGLRAELIGTPAMLRNLEILRSNYPNFAPMIDLVARAALLSKQSRANIELPPLLLLGAPGIGKTRLSSGLAKALQTDFAEISMTSIDDNAKLTGHSASWRAARPGLVAMKLIEGHTCSPVILIDEVEKAQMPFEGSANPADCLHTLLEPHSAIRFTDEFIGLPIRADKVIWILTANDISGLKPSLVDRMLVIHVAKPTASQKTAIMRSICASLTEETGALFSINDDIVAALANETPRHARRLIGLARGFAALEKRSQLIADDIRQAISCVPSTPQKHPVGFCSH